MPKHVCRYFPVEVRILVYNKLGIETDDLSSYGNQRYLSKEPAMSRDGVAVVLGQGLPKVPTR